MSKQKEDKHLDRIVRFRRTVESPVLVPPSPVPQVLQELIMVPLFFSFPDGGEVT